MMRANRTRVFRLGVVSAITVGAVATAAVLASASAHITSDVPAQPNMAALAAPGTVIADAAVPKVVSTLPPDVAPAGEAVHLLLDQGGVAQYAWKHGPRVCHADSNGNAGCFDAFTDGFNWTVSDPDLLGSGDPTYVSGLVPDGVLAVSVVVNGTPNAATVTNNAVYYSLADGSLLPSSIQSFVLTFAGGRQQTIPFDAIALPGK
jgi:hypothetical protein